MPASHELCNPAAPGWSVRLRAWRRYGRCCVLVPMPWAPTTPARISICTWSATPRIPALPERQAAFLQAGKPEALLLDHDQPGWENQWCPRNDRLRLDGMPFDVIYNTLDCGRSVVYQVKTTGAVSIPQLRFRPYTFLGLLENAVILYDADGELHEIVAGLYPYPPALRKALLATSLDTLHGSLEDMQDYNTRGIGNTAFLFHLWRVVDGLATALFALNRRYDPATKRLEEVFPSLSILPPDFIRRYNGLLETPLTPPGRLKIVAACRRWSMKSKSWQGLLIDLYQSTTSAYRKPLFIFKNLRFLNIKSGIFEFRIDTYPYIGGISMPRCDLLSTYWK